MAENHKAIDGVKILDCTGTMNMCKDYLQFYDLTANILHDCTTNT